MRIQHNITALNSHRNLMNNNSAVAKNLEKLSSGYRINRAGDDAAGLAISEKMRAQITGLQTAQKNAEDGVSLVQTAEGALTEVHSMLNRMVELATQSANGTYSTKNREEMQKEIDALTEEIDRISNTANFNGTQLFGGTATSFEAVGTVGRAAITGTSHDAVATEYTTGDIELTDVAAGNIKLQADLGSGKKVAIDVAVKDTDTVDTLATKMQEALNADATLKGAGIKVAVEGTTLKFTSEAGANAEAVTNFTIGGDSTGFTVGAGSKTATGADAYTSYDLSGTFTENDSITVDGKTYTFATGADGSDGATFSDLDTLKDALAKNGIDLQYTGTGADAKFVVGDASLRSTNVSLHVGESSDKTNTIDVVIDTMNSASIGGAKGKVADIDITTADGAKTAIDIVNGAIDQISGIRSSLGAMQNRLEHTINNLGVQTENITAAESRVRDVDMAKEMMNYTKNNILVQASQAMLAQANQVPQGVLQLLQ